MYSVEIIENCTKVFQLFGLQCFSLKSLNSKAKRHSPSAWHKIYLVTIFISFSASIGCWIKVNYEHEDNVSANSLDSIMKNMITGLIILTTASSLFVSYWKYLEMLDFYRKSQIVSSLCLMEFNYNTNFRQLKIVLLQVLWLFAFSIGSINCLFVTGVFFYENEGFYRVLISLIPVLFTNISVLRFGFHVQIVNFHLKSLQYLMSQQFSKSLMDKIMKKNNPRRKILAMRKIYTLVSKMAKNVNSSLGFTVLLNLCLATAMLVKIAYRSFIITIASLPLEKFEGDNSHI